MATPEHSAAQIDAAYREGRSAGLAIGALTMAALAYINLLSLEKSLLAIVLAWIVLSRTAVRATRTRARWALWIAIVHVLIVAAALIAFHDRLGKLVQLLVHLG